jgi:hypothetical protein
VQDNYVWVGVTSRLNPRLEGIFGVMGWLQYNAFPDSLLADPSRFANTAIMAFHFDHAEALLNLSPNPSDSLCKVEIGLFPFKENPDSKDLGDYMFRTGCYPGFIDYYGLDLTEQLGGLHISNDVTSDLFGGWHNDLFLTSELYLYPFNDFSLTFLTDFKPYKNKVLDFGAGAQLYRCFSVNNSLTHPTTNIVQSSSGGSSAMAPNYYNVNITPIKNASGQITGYDTTGGSFYTFAGTKIQARIAFDPKPLMGDIAKVLGPQDLKVYTEAIILGVKNYPASDFIAPGATVPINEFGYDKLMQKMPIMMGLDFPTFRILDVLSVEAEYYGKNYANNVPVPANGLYFNRFPLPYDPNVNAGYPYGDPSQAYASGDYSKEFYYSTEAHWKWDVYAKKTLLGNFRKCPVFS